MHRRAFITSAASVITLPAWVHAQAQPSPLAPLKPVPPSDHAYHSMSKGGAPHHLTPSEEAQRVFDSPAPAGPLGRWEARAAMPIPRSEMAWATAWQGRMHVVGGYGEGRFDRAYHTVYDPSKNAWYDAAQVPRGANHIAVVADAGRVYALGGFIEQNRRCDTKAFFYDVKDDRWFDMAPLPRPRGAAAAVVMNGKVHLIGGATDPAPERASIAWHEVYDPATDKWELRRPLPAARDHVGCVAFGNAIHVVGGRFNNFQFNTDLHHVYDVQKDTWDLRAPMPTARSGHGMVVYRNRIFCMGGEGGILQNGVPVVAAIYGQLESYDPATNTWQRHAPMISPRHAVAATAIGDWIYVAGGGPVLGGSLQSSVHEAFTLG